MQYISENLVYSIYSYPLLSYFLCLLTANLFLQEWSVYNLFLNSNLLFYEMVHNVILEEKCLPFERCSDVFHVPTHASSPNEILAALPAHCQIFMLKLPSISPYLFLLLKM